MDSFLRGNFVFVGGKVSGNQRSITDLTQNFNFETDIYSFGINLNYDFDHLYKKRSGFVQPFISLGVSTFIFNSKTDLNGSYFDEETRQIINNVPYNYWSDGSIRSIPEDNTIEMPYMMKRDFIYETPLKEIDWGAEDYADYGFAVPAEVGLDMHFTDRLTLRVSNTFFFTFSDNIDHVSSKNTRGIRGNTMPDFFNYTSVSLHMDLFSSKKNLTLEMFYRDVDYDYDMFFGDEDVDGVFDGWDNCLGTLPGHRLIHLVARLMLMKMG
ncbi:MAG: hypothetical protein HC906_13985 [Bacteroidales bacterium]|nr:hypothetical protein [Bacteroidales bacterium]